MHYADERMRLTTTMSACGHDKDRYKQRRTIHRERLLTTNGSSFEGAIGFASKVGLYARSRVAVVVIADVVVDEARSLLS